MKTIISAFTTILTAALIWSGCGPNREFRLEQEGNAIVAKVEDYKQKHHQLPLALTDIGLEEQEGMDALYYDRRDSIHYTVSFPISAEEHRFYYSDTRKWENYYRFMGK